MIDVRVTWAAFDGVFTEYTGVGTTTTYLRRAWPAARERLRAAGLRADLRLIGTATVDASGHERDQAVQGEDVPCHVVGRDCPGEGSTYGAPHQWTSWSSELVEYVASGRRPGLLEVVVLNDVHFLSAAARLTAMSGVYVLPILHSKASDWEGGGVDGTSTGRSSATRVDYERSAVRHMARIKQPLLAVSRSLSAGVARDYDVPMPGTVSLGVDPSTVEGLAAGGWPDWVDRPFAMWFGRAGLDKGMDRAAEGLAVLADATGVKSIVFAGDFGSAPDRAWAASVRNRLPRTVHYVDDHDFTTPRALLGHPLLSAVVLAPRVEPFGLIPSEFFLAAAAGSAAPVLLHSGTGGLAEQPAVVQYSTRVDTDRSGQLRWSNAVAAISSVSDAVRRERVQAGAAQVRNTLDIAACLSALVTRAIG